MQETHISSGDIKLNLPVYDGTGTYDSKGLVTYNVSLPSSAQALLQINQLMNLGDTIFVRISTPPDNIALTNPDDDVVNLSFIIPDFKLADRQVLRLFLWHDDQPVKDDKQAKIIIKECNGIALTQPGKCGNGVLTFQI